ncbi:hypothetical protein PGO_060230 [Plasmodium gonderi]|uniref:Uncharacterized protein n=1 Tax=Plasmodium gonderi TaxID=77519 RepID=A0A1Y1JBI1_PLAGO|nr:hypothetical protein PGO_060230 [Plasmodium gonderi]GAW79879.1 hypothetical protein PGO_060230 [Plasmodium gonderi]
MQGNTHGSLGRVIKTPMHIHQREPKQALQTLRTSQHISQKKYIELINLAKKLYSCQNELLCYQREEKTMQGEGDNKVTKKSLNIVTNGEKKSLLDMSKVGNHLIKKEFKISKETLNIHKSATRESKRVTKIKSITINTRKNKRKRDSSHLGKTFTKHNNSHLVRSIKTKENGNNDSKKKEQMSILTGEEQAKRIVPPPDSFKKKKKKKKNSEVTIQKFPNSKITEKKKNVEIYLTNTTQKRKKRKKKYMCTFSKTNTNKGNIINLVKCAKNEVLQKVEPSNTHYTFNNPQNKSALTDEGKKPQPGSKHKMGHHPRHEQAITQHEQPLPIQHISTCSKMEHPGVTTSTAAKKQCYNQQKRKNQRHLSKKRRKHMNSNSNNRVMVEDEECSTVNATHKEQNPSEHKKRASKIFSKNLKNPKRKSHSTSSCKIQLAKYTQPQSRTRKGLLLNNANRSKRKLTPKIVSLQNQKWKEKNGRVTRNCASNQIYEFNAAKRNRPSLDKQKDNLKSCKDLIKTLNASSVIICTKNHKKRTKKSLRTRKTKSENGFQMGSNFTFGGSVSMPRKKKNSR